VPFTIVEESPADSGERFFSEHLMWMREHKPTFDENDRCLCASCLGTQSNHNPNSSNVIKPSQNERFPEQTEQDERLNEARPDLPTAGNNNNDTAKLASVAPGTTMAHVTSTQQPGQGNRVEAAAGTAANHPIGLASRPLNMAPVHAPTTFWPSFGFGRNFSSPMPPPWHPAVMPFAAALRAPQRCCNRCMQWHNSDSRRGRPPRTALKATGLLSCLQMKIVSFRMKLK